MLALAREIASSSVGCEVPTVDAVVVSSGGQSVEPAARARARYV